MPTQLKRRTGLIPGVVAGVVLIVLLCVGVGAAIWLFLLNDPVPGPGRSSASTATGAQTPSPQLRRDADRDSISSPAKAEEPPITLEDGHVPIEVFFTAMGPNGKLARRAIANIDRHWHHNYTPIILEMLTRMGAGPRTGSLLRTLEANTGQAFGRDHHSLNKWYQWLWANDFGTHPGYADFKAKYYRLRDPRFAAYFQRQHPATIRLDEIRWGGVVRDGIPPLVKPRMIAAEEATYLGDDNVVFGIEVNGDARAYPKRILAWHEMFKDTVGGVSVNGVYCTLCGAMILYRTEYNGVHHELGTSGFLYRSNKLMYDQATESLWSTTRGEPVVGPLVGKGIKLEALSVVTSTWADWRKLHPQTTVLSLDTGHKRDYGEGVAYASYFATDALMFTVPKFDKRLANKAEILALRFGGADDLPTAIAADFLATRPVYQGQLGAQRYVILTDAGGANRVYEAGDTTFVTYAKDGTSVSDQDGRRWSVHESRLERDGDTVQLKRLAAHRAFWFGWFAAHPDTLLIMQK
jgi:hypothetical protein